jgi:hypothetical protein
VRAVVFVNPIRRNCGAPESDRHIVEPRFSHDFSRAILLHGLRDDRSPASQAAQQASGHSEEAEKLLCAKCSARIDARFCDPAGIMEKRLRSLRKKGKSFMWSQVSSLATGVNSNEELRPTTQPKAVQRHLRRTRRSRQG